MATKPTKPSNVHVGVLKEVLSDLQTLQNKVNSPPPGSFTALGADVKSDLPTMTTGDCGLTDIAGIDDIDKRYQDTVGTVNQAWPAVTQGIGALITMLNDTITRHGKADADASDNASKTNTTQAPASGGRGLN